MTRLALVIVLAIALLGCSTTSPSTMPSPLTTLPVVTATVSPVAATPAPTAVPPTAVASTPLPSAMPGGVYAAPVSGLLAPSVAGLKPLVYVPDEGSRNVLVIDPQTFKIIRTDKVGQSPEHITPDWDLGRLYVNNMNSSNLTIIDPTTSKVIGSVPVPYPYNLYFSEDGSKAIVVDDYLSKDLTARNGLYFYDRVTWKLLKFVDIRYAGADHLDFSADGSYLLVSCETSGEVVKVDVASMRVVGAVRVGGLPLDVRLDPSGNVFWVANQGTNVVDVVDGDRMKLIDFIRTGAGAHGLGLSRDVTRLFVTNRIAGTISVIDLATRAVVDTWRVGGSPDMIATSIDGSQLWVSNRYDGTVIVLDSTTGKILKTIVTGRNPHGLVYWPQPGRFSLGHNGNMR